MNTGLSQYQYQSQYQNKLSGMADHPSNTNEFRNQDQNTSPLGSTTYQQRQLSSSSLSQGRQISLSSTQIPHLTYTSNTTLLPQGRSPSSISNIDQNRSIGMSTFNTLLPPFVGSSPQQPGVPNYTQQQPQQLKDLNSTYAAPLPNPNLNLNSQQSYIYPPQQQSQQSYQPASVSSIQYYQNSYYTQPTQQLQQQQYNQTGYQPQQQQQQQQQQIYQQYPQSSTYTQQGYSQQASTGPLVAQQVTTPTSNSNIDQQRGGYDGVTYYGYPSQPTSYPHSPIRHFRPNTHSRSRSKHQFLNQFVSSGQPQSLPKSSTAWSPEDDKLLRSLKEEKKLGWREISSYFPNRTLNACQFRWRRIVIGVAADKSNNDIKSPIKDSPSQSDKNSYEDKNSKTNISNLIN